MDKVGTDSNIGLYKSKLTWHKKQQQHAQLTEKSFFLIPELFLQRDLNYIIVQCSREVKKGGKEQE